MKNATVKINKHKDKFITVFGKIKDERTVYGRKEYLITKAKMEDFWVTQSSIILMDD